MRTLTAATVLTMLCSLGGCALEEAPPELPEVDEAEDVYWGSKQTSGYVAFFDVPDALRDSPTLSMPQGVTTLYSYFGSPIGSVDMGEYRSASQEGRAGVYWGGCFEVTELGHPLRDSRLGYATHMCQVTLIKRSVSITGALYLLAETRVPGAEVETPYGDLEGRIFIVDRGLRLVQFHDGAMTIVDAVLKPGAVVRLRLDSPKTITFESGTEGTLYEVEASSYGEISPP